MSFFFLRVLNIVLRGSTLVGKFLLLFFLAIFLEPKDVGVYGLIYATIAYTIYFLGFDFYKYSSREIVRSSKEEWFYVLRDQFTFFGILFLLLSPLISGLFFFEVLPIEFVGWFYVLLIFEHLSQEGSRVLVAMSKQSQASVVIFLKGGGWIFLLVPLMYTRKEFQSLQVIFSFWAVGSLLAAFLAFLFIKKDLIIQSYISVNWKWIKRGVVVAFPILLASLMFRVMFVADRFVMEHISGADLLAVYVVYISLANGIISFLDSAVFSFFYPSLIKAASLGRVEFDLILKKMFLQTAAISLVGAFLVLLFVKAFFSFVGLDLYLEHIDILCFLLVMILLFSLSMVPHYALYSLGDDKSIVVGHFYAFATYSILVSCAIFLRNYYVMLTALLVVFTFLSSYKFFRYKQYSEFYFKKAI